jgi:hypothetical protein
MFLCEFGADQESSIRILAESVLGREFGSVSIVADLAGLPRLLKVQRY